LLREILDKAAQRVGSELKNVPEGEASLRLILGQVYLDMGDYAKAEAMCRESLAIETKIHGSEHVHVARSLLYFGRVLRHQKKLAEAEPLLRQGLALARKLLGRETKEVAACASELAFVLIEEDLGNVLPIENLLAKPAGAPIQ